MKEKAILIAVAIILAASVYDKYSLRNEHNKMVNEAKKFMGQGERFTKKRGDELELRVQALEAEVYGNKEAN